MSDHGKAIAKHLDRALYSHALPVNPVPFANRLSELTLCNTAAIRSGEAKRLLWVLMSQAYGQCAIINLHEEWTRLTREFAEEEVKRDGH